MSVLSRRIGSLVLAAGMTVPATAGLAADVDRFGQPSEAELADDARRVVVDQPTSHDFDTEAVFDPNPMLAALVGRLELFPPEAWTVAAVARTFDGDPTRALAFVRERIRLDPYRGVLRGAQGTLAARAGSAADRAVLLAALLGEMGFTTRFAFADLDAATAGRLADQALSTPDGPPADIGAHEVLDAGFLDAVDTRARRDHALLLGALDGRVEDLGVTSPRDPTADVAHHVWVQLERDGTWVDLDPSVTDASDGRPLAPPATTAAEIPVGERASVSVRILAENLVDGYVEGSVALDQRVDAAAATNATVMLTFLPEGGGGLLDIGGGGPPSAYQPVLMVDGEPSLGSPVRVLGASDDFFGTGSDVRLTRLAIQLASEAPGRDPVVRERVLLDRVPPEARSAGSWTVDDLDPMPVVDELPAVMLGVHHLLVSTGGSDPIAALEGSIAAVLVAADDLSTDDAPERATLSTVMLPQTSYDAQLVLASEHAIVAGLDRSTSARVFIGRPRAFLVSIGPDPAGSGAVQVTTDLAIDGIDIVAARAGDPTDDAALRLWYGAAEGALETEFGLGVARSGTPDTLQLAGLSLAMTEPLSVVTDPSQAMGGAEGLVRTLADGWLAVVPGDVATARSWWAISPADGETLALLASGGRAFESMFFPLHWGKSWDPISQQYVGWYDKTVKRRRCGGGNEYGQLQECVVRPTTQQLTAMYVRLMRQYARYLLIPPP